MTAKTARLGLALAATLMLAAPALAQAPKLDGSSLGWLAGNRVHTNADGGKVYQSYVGPANGVVTGTALVAIGKERTYQEFHRIGPNTSGVYGLSVASTRSGFTWNFVPVKSIEADKITFQSEDGSITVSYFKEPGGGVGSRVVRTLEGKSQTLDWHFKPTSAPQ